MIVTVSPTHASSTGPGTVPLNVHATVSRSSLRRTFVSRMSILKVLCELPAQTARCPLSASCEDAASAFAATGNADTATIDANTRATGKIRFRRFDDDAAAGFMIVSSSIALKGNSRAAIPLRLIDALLIVLPGLRSLLQPDVSIRYNHPCGFWPQTTPKPPSAV